MTYDEIGKKICGLIDPEGKYTSDICLELASFYIKEGQKNALKKEDNRDLGAIMQATKTVQDILVNNAVYTDTAIVLAAIKILADFSLKMIDKMKEDK